MCANGRNGAPYVRYVAQVTCDKPSFERGSRASYVRPYTPTVASPNRIATASRTPSWPSMSPLPSRLSPSPKTCDPHPTPTRGEARLALCRLTPRQMSGEEDHDLSHPRRARPVLPRPRRPPRPRRQPPGRPPRRPLAPRPRHPRLARLSLLMQTWARRRVQRVTLIAPNVTVAHSDGEVAVGGARVDLGE